MNPYLALACLACTPPVLAPSGQAPQVFTATPSSLVTPDGKPFWSFGVDCVGVGTNWETADPSNPSYSAFKLFSGGKAWVEDTLGKFKNWGVNSLGGWSDTELFDKYAPKDRLPYFVVLHLGAYDQAPWHDMFAAQFEKAVGQAAKDQIPKLANDTKLVGYFSDNELGWWGDTLFTSYLSMSATSPGKRRLMDLIRGHYGGSFEALRQDWTTSAKDFDEVSKLGKLQLRAGGNGIKLINKWVTVLATRYYSFMRSTIRRYDTRHLILGDRYCQYYNLEIAKASRPYIDVASTNYGSEWNDGTISNFFLNTLHRATGKPVIITEFYMCAMENRSGNKNSSGGFPIVQTQAERSAAFKRYVESVASLPYVVGAHWFQFYDEPSKGRGDGENYNMGLVDVKGEPYEGMVEAMKSFDFPTLRSKREASPNSTISMPPGKPMDGLKSWPKRSSFIASESDLPMADLYVTQDDKYLYFGLLSMDYMDEGLYENHRIPESERALWTIWLGDASKPLEIRFGGDKRNPTCSDSSVTVKDYPNLKHEVIARVPLPANGKIRFRSIVTTHSRGETTSWRFGE